MGERGRLLWCTPAVLGKTIPTRHGSHAAARICKIPALGGGARALACIYLRVVFALQLHTMVTGPLPASALISENSLVQLMWQATCL